MNKTTVQEQFGKTAANYLTSKSNALGKSLERLVTLTVPQKTWRMLDVATGAGHTAYTFAPHVERLWAVDVTPEMLDQVKAQLVKRGIANVRVAYAPAESLPFEDASFDLVTCRLAAHHFDSIPAFLAEAHRVLRPGGVFALVDNVVPEGSVGDYVNAFERFRDPSHLRALTVHEWRDALEAAHFAIAHEETIDKRMEFKSWASRHDAVMLAQLSALLKHVTPEVRAFFQPQGDGDDLTFNFREGIFIARRA